MPNVGVVTDSTCDVEPEVLEALGVKMVPLLVTFGDDRYYRDWIDIRPDEFYRRLTTSATLPATSQPSPAEFSAAYQELADAGHDEIVVITISSAFSGTFDSAALAANDAPVPVRVVDSKNVSQGAALIVFEALEAARSGLPGEMVEQRARQIVESLRLYFILDTLDYLVKGGRAGKAAGLAASLLNIKPVLRMNADGIIEPFRKVRGRQQAVATLAQHVAEDSQTRGHLKGALLHGHVEGEGEELETALAEAGADIEIVSRGIVGSVIGTYAGPGAVGVAYYPVG